MGLRGRVRALPWPPLSAPSDPHPVSPKASKKERPLLAFARKTLDEGPREVRAPLPTAWLAAQLEEDDAADDADVTAVTAAEDGAIDARISPAGGDAFLLQGHVRAKVTTTCARCLGPAIVPLDAEVTLLLVPDSKAPKAGKRSKQSDDEVEFDADEADVATYDGETVVLDPLVREAILLELPISPLCDEACPGMASPPSPPPVERHASFREKLAALKQQLPSDESKPGKK